MLRSRGAVYLAVLVSCACSDRGPTEHPADAAQVDAADLGPDAAQLDAADLGPDATAYSPPPEIQTAGTRLVPRAGDPGRHIFWYDTELDIDCMFVHAQDGRWRCLPDPGGSLPPLLYLDPNCEQPHLPYGGGDCPETVTYGEPTNDPCAGHDLYRDYVFRVVALAPYDGPIEPPGLPSGLASYARDSSGNCIELPEPQLVGCRVGADVSLEMFMAADEVTEPLGPLNRVFLVAEDGATELRGAELAEFSIGLEPYNGRLRPFERTGGASTDSPQYADAACATPAVCMVDSECDEDLLEVWEGDCDMRLFRAGTAVDAVWEGDECRASDPAGGCLLRGEEIGPYATELTVHGDRRLQTAWYTWSGFPIAPAGYYDAELQTRCYRALSADRCVPEVSEWAFERVYKDPACEILQGGIPNESSFYLSKCEDLPNAVQADWGSDAAAYRVVESTYTGPRYVLRDTCINHPGAGQLYDFIPVALEDLPALDPW